MSEQEVLVVASKIKKYIKEKAALNTASTVMEALSAAVRALTDQAIENAKRDGRKTVMDRDIPNPRGGAPVQL